MFGWVCAGIGIALLVSAIGQQAEDHFWPKQVVSYASYPMVPVYELRRQQEEAQVKRYRYGFI